MGIQAVTPPATSRTSKYEWPDADVKTAEEMLDTMKSNLDAPPPGDGPFDTEGEARSAANALVTQLGERGKTVGVRTWADGKTKPTKRQRGDKEITVEVGKFYFALKNGRRKYNRNGDAETTGEAS